MQNKDCGMTRRIFVKKSIQTLAAANMACMLARPEQAMAKGKDGFDVIIKNGLVYDGTLNPPYLADIGIHKDRIKTIGNVAGEASKIIDARGLIVTPGFIDIHTHCDLTFKRTGIKRYLAYILPSWKGNYNYLYQGVTTVVSGNCGYGYTDTEKWLGMVDSVGFGTNVYHLAPHGMIREEMFGENQPGELSASQLDIMKGRIEEEMQKGAVGLSTGLEYAPGLLASTKELIELAKVAQKHGGLYTTHMRDESGTMTADGIPAVLASIGEAVEVCRRAEIPVEISHLKVAEPINNTKAQQVLAAVEMARQQGLPIMADQYPYAAGSTYITILLPDSMKTSDSIRAEFKTRTGRQEVARAIERVFDYLPPEKTLITMYPNKENYEGKTIKEIAALENRRASETYVEMVCEDQAPMGVFFAQNMDIVREFMREDYIVTASDGWTVPKGMTNPHPRVYGTFPRKLKKFVMQEKILDIGQAIYSMTSLPAEKFNMTNRGRLAENYFADVAVIDLHRLADKSTYKDPHHYATGVKHLFVNGVQSIENGKATGDRGGRALKRT